MVIQARGKEEVDTNRRALIIMSFSKFDQGRGSESFLKQPLPLQTYYVEGWSTWTKPCNYVAQWIVKWWTAQKLVIPYQTKCSGVMASSHVVASHITKILSSVRQILQFRFRENRQGRIPPWKVTKTRPFLSTCYGPASTSTICQPKPNRWFNVGPTATYLVGPTLLCSLDTRWPNIKPPTMNQHSANHEPTFCQPWTNNAPTVTIPTIIQRWPNRALLAGNWDNIHLIGDLHHL